MIFTIYFRKPALPDRESQEDEIPTGAGRQGEAIRTPAA